MTEKDILCFYSGSADKLPGKGSGERVVNASVYNDLAQIPNWRRILSNFYFAPFIYAERKYNMVEHAFQAKKIEIADPDLAKSIACKGTGLDARKMRKCVILNNKQLSEWENKKNRIMFEILMAKFTQVEIAKKVLLATKNCQLYHSGPRIKKSRQHTLEAVRQFIS